MKIKMLMRRKNTTASAWAWTVIPFVIFSSFVSANVVFDDDDRCTREYEKLTSRNLQFLYRLDGNLNSVNMSKKKRIAYVNRIWESGEETPEARNRAYVELFSDPDYWEMKVKDDAGVLISKFENFVSSHSWTRFKNNLNDKDGFYFLSFSGISAMDRLYAKSRDFTETLTITDLQLERLGYYSYFEDATGMNAYQFAINKMEIGMILGKVKGCQLSYLESVLSNKNSKVD